MEPLLEGDNISVRVFSGVASMFIGEQKNSERQKEEIRKIAIPSLIKPNWCNSVPVYVLLYIIN